MNFRALIAAERKKIDEVFKAELAQFKKAEADHATKVKLLEDLSTSAAAAEKIDAKAEQAPPEQPRTNKRRRAASPLAAAASPPAAQPPAAQPPARRKPTEAKEPPKPPANVPSGPPGTANGDATEAAPPTDVKPLDAALPGKGNGAGRKPRTTTGRAIPLAETIDPQIIEILTKRGSITAGEIRQIFGKNNLSSLRSLWQKRARALGMDIDDLIPRSTTDAGESLYTITERGRIALGFKPSP